MQQCLRCYVRLHVVDEKVYADVLTISVPPTMTTVPHNSYDNEHSRTNNDSKWSCEGTGTVVSTPHTPAPMSTSHGNEGYGRGPHRVVYAAGTALQRHQDMLDFLSSLMPREITWTLPIKLLPPSQHLPQWAVHMQLAPTLNDKPGEYYASLLHIAITTIISGVYCCSGDDDEVVEEEENENTNTFSLSLLSALFIHILKHSQHYETALSEGSTCSYSGSLLTLKVWGFDSLPEQALQSLQGVSTQAPPVFPGSYTPASLSAMLADSSVMTEEGNTSDNTATTTITTSGAVSGNDVLDYGPGTGISLESSHHRNGNESAVVDPREGNWTRGRAVSTEPLPDYRLSGLPSLFTPMSSVTTSASSSTFHSPRESSGEKTHESIANTSNVVSATGGVQEGSTAVSSQLGSALSEPNDSSPLMYEKGEGQEAGSGKHRSDMHVHICEGEQMSDNKDKNEVLWKSSGLSIHDHCYADDAVRGDFAQLPSPQQSLIRAQPPSVGNNTGSLGSAFPGGGAMGRCVLDKKALSRQYRHHMSYCFQDREAGIFYQTYENALMLLFVSSQNHRVAIAPIDIEEQVVPPTRRSPGNLQSNVKEERFRALKVEVYGKNVKDIQATMANIGRTLNATTLSRVQIFFPKVLGLYLPPFSLIDDCHWLMTVLTSLFSPPPSPSLSITIITIIIMLG